MLYRWLRLRYKALKLR